ncbi:MAG: glycosyltransferase, partial [Anaerolineae bacterium]|nr:glycosyltransferase [Anaerolineae bacterium]
MRDLAVIIVTWNVRELVIDALRTLLDDLAISGLQAQVVVVDSASHDGTPEAIRQHFPQVDLIACDDNLGFAAANNRALRQLGFGQSGADVPRAVFLLNPDTLTR